MVATVSLVAIGLLGCGCSSQPSAVPTAARKAPIRSATASTTSTTSVPSTSLPSATPTTVPSPVVQAPGWSSTLTTLPPGGGFASLSCISDTFCVTAGGGTTGDDSSLTVGSGVAVSWDGATWSDPSVYFPDPVTGPVTAPVLPTIDCTSGPTCVIVDGSDHVSDGDGTNWSAPAAMAPGPSLPANPQDPGTGHAGSRSAAVSCPAPTFCAAVDNTGHAFARRNGSWAPTQPFGLPGPKGGQVSLYQAGRVGVACATSSSCTAVVGATILDWDGITWSEEPAPWVPASAGGPSGSTAVACPTTSWCVIASGSAVSFRSAGQGSAWSAEQTVDDRGGLDSISCPSTTFCVAADGGGSVVVWNGTSWSTPHQVIPVASEYPELGTSVSCPDTGFCMVMNGDGDYATYSSGTGPPTGAEPMP
ncbi:MAG: hypothetical protein ACLQPH_04225 [Acidimicrobiales bacterium]